MKKGSDPPKQRTLLEMVQEQTGRASYSTVIYSYFYWDHAINQLSEC
ncbi:MULTISPECIES: hypothetical protein [unclassified Paenibacillus]|nr:MULTISPECIES: hypothetical protein [unclassified Paenibacillus]MDQ0901970.1 hypothetical protein [Paenibacillus sp. V4I7]MDQ0919533.1 hypothetical protein [Paenibacillus sp. V4I5]